MVFTMTGASHPGKSASIHQFACLHDNYGFLLADHATGRVATIDTPDANAILKVAESLGWTITDIWNTHWHPDHAGGNATIVAATGARVTGPQEVADRFGPVDELVRHGDLVSLGQTQASIIDVGGHTLGHIAYHLADSAHAFVGDALFALGCGRLFEGSADQAWGSLSRLMALPDHTTIWCAHEYTQANARFCASLGVDDPAWTARFEAIAAARARGEPTVPTSIGLERATNPFVLASEPALRAALDLRDVEPAQVFAEVRRRKDVFA
jgi:hydroxyacylglutathione hydrolase